MSDYIDRKKLLKKKQYSFQTQYGAFPRHDYFIKISDIRSMPTVDTEKHAHWIVLYSDVGYVTAKCSNCFDSKRKNIICVDNESDFYPYCPFCGCKMDKNKIKEK